MRQCDIPSLPTGAGHDDGHVRVWNLELCSTLNMKRHTNTVSAVTVGQIDMGSGHLGERLFSCSFDGTVAVWEVRKVGAASPHPVFTPPFWVPAQRPSRPGGQRHVACTRTAPHTPCAWHDTILPLLSQEGDIRPHMIARWEAHNGVEVLSILYDPMKRVILTAGNDKLIRVRALCPTPTFMLPVQEVRPASCTCKEWGVQVLCGARSPAWLTPGDPAARMSQVWSNSSFRLVGEHVGHREAVTCMALDANFLFSGSEDSDIKMWDTVPNTG